MSSYENREEHRKKCEWSAKSTVFFLISRTLRNSSFAGIAPSGRDEWKAKSYLTAMPSLSGSCSKFVAVLAYWLGGTALFLLSKNKKTNPPERCFGLPVNLSSSAVEPATVFLVPAENMYFSKRGYPHLISFTGTRWNKDKITINCLSLSFHTPVFTESLETGVDLG